MFRPVSREDVEEHNNNQFRARKLDTNIQHYGFISWGSDRVHSTCEDGLTYINHKGVRSDKDIWSCKGVEYYLFSREILRDAGF